MSSVAGDADPVPERIACQPMTDLGLSGFEVLTRIEGARRFHPASIRRWVYARGIRSIADMTDLPKALRATLAERYVVRGSRIARRLDSEDGTIKLLLELRDDRRIEAVLIPEADRLTLCVSTQVGCGVRCAFCASGVEGVARNLSAGEIVEQFLWARELAAEHERTITNLVLMGGGEPLNNFDAVKDAVEILNSEHGLGFGARRITLSTIGIPSKIDRLEELDSKINLAISLHAPNETLRGQLIPGLDRIPLQGVLAAAGRYFQRTGREVTFEYVLLKGVNDSAACATELRDLLRGVRCSVNLIPLNPHPDSSFERPAEQAVEAVAGILRAGGIQTTVRRSRGRDIQAACGQLKRQDGGSGPAGNDS